MWKKALLVLMGSIYFFLTPLWSYLGNENIVILSSFFVLPLFACLPPAAYVLLWGYMFTGMAYNAHDQLRDWGNQEKIFGVSLYFYVLLTWCGLGQRQALVVSVICSHPATVFDDLMWFILASFLLGLVIYSSHLVSAKAKPQKRKK